MAIGFVVLLRTLGWRNELDSATDIGTSGAGKVARTASRTWYDKILPTLQATRWFAIGGIVLSALIACFLDLSGSYLALVIVTALILFAALYFAGRPVAVTWSTSVIAVGDTSVDITFGVTFSDTPVVVVTPINKLHAPKIANVHRNGCTVVIDAAEAYPVELNWHVSARPEGAPALWLIATMCIGFVMFASVLFATGLDAFSIRSAGFKDLFLQDQAAERIHHWITADLMISQGVPYLLVVFIVLVLGLWKLLTYLYASGISSVEFFLGFPGAVIECIGKKSLDPLHEFALGLKDSKRQVNSIANQEKPEKTRTRWVMMLSMYFVGLITTTLGYPGVWHFLAWRFIDLASFAVMLVLEYIEYRYMSRIIDLDDEASKRHLKVVRDVMAGMRLSGALVLGLVYLAYGALIVICFLNPMAGLNLLDKGVATFSSTLGWITDHLVMMSTLFASGILGAVALILSRRSAARGLAIPFAILASIALVAGIWGVFKAEAPRAENELMGAGKLVPLSGLEAQVRPDGKVELGWDDMTGSHGVKIQRRLETETKFVDVTPAVLEVGIHDWIDPTPPIKGQARYYSFGQPELGRPDSAKRAGQGIGVGCRSCSQSRDNNGLAPQAAITQGVTRTHHNDGVHQLRDQHRAAAALCRVSPLAGLLVVTYAVVLSYTLLETPQFSIWRVFCYLSGFTIDKTAKKWYKASNIQSQNKGDQG